MKLQISNLDYSAWATTGQDGVWLGIGFGSTVMKGADFIICEFSFTGTSNINNFRCTDRIATSSSRPFVDSVEDVTTLNTTRVYDEANKLATLSTTFSRKLNTLDTNQDFLLTNGQSLSAIWAWGAMSSTTILNHGSSALKRNTFTMKLNALNSWSILCYGTSMLLAMVTFITMMY